MMMMVMMMMEKGEPLDKPNKQNVGWPYTGELNGDWPRSRGAGRCTGTSDSAGACAAGEVTLHSNVSSRRLTSGLVI